MPMRDQQISWKRKKVFIEPLRGMGWTTGGTVPLGLHTGAPVAAEMSTFGYAVIQFDAASDEWVQFWQIPYDLDPEHPVYIAVLWSTAAAAADTADFIVTYTRLGVESELAAAATALNTAIAQDTHTGTTLTINRTEQGKINGGTLTADDYLVFETEIDASTVGDGAGDFTSGSEYIYFLGLEITYTPRMCAGIGQSYEAPTS